MTFVNYQYQIVDTYVKVSSAPPRVGGMEAAGRLDVLSVVPRGDGQGLREAFEKLKSDGSLDKLPGFDHKTKNMSPWP